MSNKEKVIKGLEECAGNGKCTKCQYGKEKQVALSCKKLLTDALALLKEQEAIKPIYDEEKYGDHLPHCGNCEKVLPNNAVYGKINFCHYCGQAVKWNA